jgi:hypothetical protein
MFEVIFTTIGFACLGISIAMMLEQINTFVSIPTMLRCNKCIAFWTALVYCYFTGQPLLIAPIAAVMAIIIYHRL